MDIKRIPLLLVGKSTHPLQFMFISVESVEACDWQCRVPDFTTKDANKIHVEAYNHVVIYVSMERVIRCWFFGSVYKMAKSELDLLTSFWINVVVTAAFLISYVLLKKLPLNFRVYYPRRYLKGLVERVDDLVKLDDGKDQWVGWWSCLNLSDWISSTWRTTETEFIEQYGLDSAVLLRTYLFGLKLFVPLMIWGLVVLIPVNTTDTELQTFQSVESNVTYSRVDTLSIANVHDLSQRLWAHLLASYVYTIWTISLLYIEYSKVSKRRLDYIASQKQRPEHFTVLVRHVPKDKSVSVGEKIREFFEENHPEHYLTHQVVYNARKLHRLIKKVEKYGGELETIVKSYEARIDADPEASRPTLKKHWYSLCVPKLDAIDFYKDKISQLKKEVRSERKNVLSHSDYVVKAGFVSFNSCWGAAVCAQSLQSGECTKWLTEWASEPRDVYWRSLSLNYVQLNAYRLIVNILVVALIIFFFIPVAFVQSLANLDTLIKYFPFLKPIIRWSIVRSFFQGYLPGLLLRIIVVMILPPLLRVLTKFEGHVSYSKIDKYAALKYYIFMVVNVFFGNVFIGSLFEQLRQYIAAPTTIPKTFGFSVPMKATFFMSYIMVDGWSANAAEILRLWPLFWYHVSSFLFVRTEKDRVKILPASPPDYTVILTRLSLYLLLGLVYAVISPLILPFLVVFFAFGYLVYRNQIVNVYEPRYECAASFWPFIHRNVIIALIIKHLTIIGLFSLKKAVASTPFLLPLPILTIVFHLHCCQKFLPAFKNFPLQEALRKDNLGFNLDTVNMLEKSYLHPAIQLSSTGSDSDDPDTVRNGTPARGGKDQRRSGAPGKHHGDSVTSGKSVWKNSRATSIDSNEAGNGSVHGSNGRCNHVQVRDPSALSPVAASFHLPVQPRGRAHHLSSRSWPSSRRFEMSHASFRNLL